MEVERDLPFATVSIRAFKQHVDDQLVTLFGFDMAGAPAAIGHYFIDNGGDVSAAGIAAGVRTALSNRLHGSVEDFVARARVEPPESAAAMLVLAPSAVRIEAERVHDVATAIETDVPETATHVVVLYRVSNAFTRSGAASAPVGTVRLSQSSMDPRPALDARF